MMLRRYHTPVIEEEKVDVAVESAESVAEEEMVDEAVESKGKKAKKKTGK